VGLQLGRGDTVQPAHQFLQRLHVLRRQLIEKALRLLRVRHRMIRCPPTEQLQHIYPFVRNRSMVKWHNRVHMAGAIAKDSKELAPGYRTLHLVGQGGQAQVWLAERVHDGKQLALKVLDRSLRQDAVFLERFVREYKLLASLENENIVRIYDQGFSGDYPYIAMEFLAGGTLASRIREGLGSRDTLRIMSQIARALDPIHARGIIHRDL